MNGSGRGEALFFALALSIAAHVATMFWMKPQVMTRIEGAGARSRMRMPARFNTVSPEALAKELAQFAAPASESSAPEAAMDALAPRAAAPDALAPGEAPGGGEAPAAEPQTPPEPEALAAPVLFEPLLAESRPGATPGEAGFKVAAPDAARDPAPVPLFSRAAPPPVSAPPPQLDDSSAPRPQIHGDLAAVFAGVDADSIPPADPVSSGERENGDKDAGTEPPFVPPAEVMPEIDVRTVEKEKEAVRNLLDIKDAGNLEDKVSVEAMSASMGEWSYFKLRLSPGDALSIVPKDVVVLFDASGSIANDRLDSCREAARKVLRTCMNSGDRFNLVAFRDNFEYAFRQWRDCDAAAYADAEKWMSKLAAHGRTDVFSTIASVLKLPRSPARPLVALVITDGDANSGVTATSRIISRFTALNDGLVSIYMYGVKRSANRELIDILTHGNRGDGFIHQGDRSQAGAGIDDIAASFRDPVLSDLRIVFTTLSGAEAFPRRLKNLYRGQTLEICGRVPAHVKEVAFSLKGLHGRTAYEGFFKVDLAKSRFDRTLPSEWEKERRADAAANGK